MEFMKNAPVLTAEGEKIGHIDRVVIDPKTKTVTHIVIRKGFVFAENKVLPISLVASGDEQVQLRENAGDLKAFPKFEEKNYILVDEDEHKRIAPHLTTDAIIMYAYPSYGGMQSSYPLPHITPRIEQNIPEGTIALQQGAAVISIEGKHVGTIAEILTGSQAGRVTHFVVSHGLPLNNHKLVPVAWVDSFEEDTVHLSVGASLFEKLPEYRLPT